MPDFDLVMMEAPVVRFKTVKEKKNRERRKDKPKSVNMKAKAVNMRRR
jgi:hypothetical protein